MHHEPTLSDYALIGNSCSAALISKFGSIDWCCLPEFDSPSVFAALLDREKGGYFSIAPRAGYRSTQKYIPDTNVVETIFKTDQGSVRLIDAFTATTEERHTASLFPDLEILRIVEGISGEVRLQADYAPRIFFGRDLPDLKNHKALGIGFSWKENIITLLSTLDPPGFQIENNNARARADFTVTEGQTVIFSLSYSNQSPAILPELKETSPGRMRETISFWKNWIAKCRYTGIYHELVKRSVLTLKLLAHAPSGAIIAAPTTSLPEKIGGERNWDYRYCWLRDASFTTRVLVKLGFEEEAHAYMNWILHATQLTRPELQVVYSIYGHSKLEEQTLDWLSGYRNSKPVRIGNKADVQFQLDVYGEVLDAIYAYAPLVKTFDNDSKKFIVGLGDVLCKIWSKPDNGIWEIRTSRVHHTHSKVMAWVGLDRLIKLCRKYRWTDAPVKKYQDTAALIRDQVEMYGYNPRIKSYTRAFNGTDVDASLLTLSLVGYCDYNAPRMISTVNRVCEELSDNNLIYRYRGVDDGLGGDEGSFAICNFWLVENLIQSGRIDEAIKIFETALHCAGPAGLLSEQIDPTSHELTGNYPQAFTHIGLVNAAMAMNDVITKKKAKYEYS
ncbi:MAG TPA: glycoside hydrolase family 15 protein [Chryseosolibacter sp.]|nr:glycoside hydrolase family 15 protein [Chryseosolibacter sp.]